MFKTGQETIDFIAAESVDFVDIRFTDVSGRWQHFSLPASGFEADAFDEGLGFDGSSIQGFQAIEASDMILLPDPASAFVDPFTAHKTLVIVADIADPISGELYGKDPRGVAKRAEAFLKGTGIADTVYMGPEAEFFVFDGVAFSSDPYNYGFRIEAFDAHTDPDEIGDGYWVKPKGGYFPVAPSDKYQDLRSEMVMHLEAAGVPVEVHHHEVATAGQAEIDIRFDTLTTVADNIIKYKYIVRNTAAMMGKTATFLPKPLYGDNGSGMHTHQSLWKDGEPIFHQQGGYAGLSDLAMKYVAGLLAHGPALTALTNPTVNSYRRLVPGYEAPVNLILSARNRSAIIRVPMYSESPKAKRIEYRAPDPTANPYLAFAASTRCRPGRRAGSNSSRRASTRRSIPSRRTTTSCSLGACSPKSSSRATSRSNARRSTRCGCVPLRWSSSSTTTSRSIWESSRTNSPSRRQKNPHS